MTELKFYYFFGPFDFLREGSGLPLTLMLPLFGGLALGYAGYGLKRYQRKAGIVAVLASVLVSSLHILLQARMSLVGLILMVAIIICVLTGWKQLKS